MTSDIANDSGRQADHGDGHHEGGITSIQSFLQDTQKWVNMGEYCTHSIKRGIKKTFCCGYHVLYVYPVLKILFCLLSLLWLSKVKEMGCGKMNYLHKEEGVLF